MNNKTKQTNKNLLSLKTHVIYISFDLVQQFSWGVTAYDKHNLF
jgi:hypothetical protein